MQSHKLKIMNKVHIPILTFLLSFSLAYGQLPALQDEFGLYKDAQEFYQKALYNQSLQKLSEFLANEQAGKSHSQHPQSSVLEQNDLYANARFYQAACYYFMEKEGTEQLLRNFIAAYPEHSQNHYAYFYLGRLLFKDFRYKEVIEPLLAASKKGEFTETERQDLSFDLGYSYFMQKDYANADKYFTKLCAKGNAYQEPSIYYHSLISYIDGNYEEAFDGFSQVENSPKYGKEVSVLMANCLMKLKRFDDLYVLADKLAKEAKPENQDPQVYFIVANASYERKEYANAIKYFDLYEKKGEKMNRSANLRYGYSHYALEHYAGAIPIFERVLSDNDSLGQFSSYYLGFCFMKENRMEDARYAYLKAATAEEGDETVREDALYQVAKLSFSTHNYSEALGFLRKLESNYPKAPYAAEVKNLIGEILLVNQNYPEAISYFEGTKLTSNRSKLAYQTVCYYYGLEKVTNQEYDEAETYLQKAIINNYDKQMALSAMYWIGECAFKKGDFAQAIQTFDKFKDEAGSANNEYGSLVDYSLGWVYFKEKKYSSAQKNFDMFLAAKNKNGATPDRIADAYLRAGDCAFVKKEYASATKYYEKAEQVNYKDQDYALYQRAEGTYRQSKYDESIKKFADLVQKYPDSELRDDALDRVSDIYVTWKKDPKKSAIYAKKLVDEYPRSPFAPAAYGRLAQAAYDEGDQEGTIRYYKKILNDYAFDAKNCQIALDNLSGIMEPNEYDKLIRDFRVKNPKSSDQLNDLTLKTAEDRFYSGSYNAAIELLNDYLADNPTGKKLFEALFFRAESYKNSNQLQKAFADYEEIYNASTQNMYVSKALEAAAKLRYEQKEFKKSRELYQLLDQGSESIEDKVVAKFGVAKNCAALLDYACAISVLTDITNMNEADQTDKNKASVLIGNAHFNTKKYEDALRIYREIAETNRDNQGAEAQYMIAKTLYEQGKYKEAVDAAKFMRNNFPDSEWKARSFLVVAEANVKMGNSYQAKAVLESLMKDDRYPNVIKLAEDRLKELQKEGAKMVQEGEQPSGEEETPVEEEPKGEEPKKPEPKKPTETKKPEPKKATTPTPPAKKPTETKKPATPAPKKGKGK